MPVQKELDRVSFNTVVRWAKSCDEDRLLQLEEVLENALRRLGVRGDITKAIGGGKPAGSDHFDSGSLKTWTDKIMADDKLAVQQIVALHATVVKRKKG